MTGIAVKNPNDPAGVTLYTVTTNGGTQNHKGVEALLKYTIYQSDNGFIRSIHPFGNFTYSDFKYEDFKFHYINPGNKDSASDYSGHHVAGVPKFTGNLGLDLCFSMASTEISLMPTGIKCLLYLRKNIYQSIFPFE